MKTIGEFTERQVEIMEKAATRIDVFGIQQFTMKSLAADMELSEPALYRHFNSKNTILLNVLEYFLQAMRQRIQGLLKVKYNTRGEELLAIFNSQFHAFQEKPAVVSVIFAENIFHFDHKLSEKVMEIMKHMHAFVKENVLKGQEEGQYITSVDADTLSTIIIGGIRLRILQWKMDGRHLNLEKSGQRVLNGILEMIENK